MTTLEVHRYSQNPEQVIACQVTANNLEAVADWTGGDLHWHTRGHHGWIHVDGSTTPAVLGAWVLRYPQGEFKVLSDVQFRARYHRTETTT